MKKLKEIIDSIKYGYHFRSEKTGDIKYLKGNQFDDDLALRDDKVSFVDIGKTDRHVLLDDDDVVLAAKGTRNFAWKCSSSYGSYVASSLFFVIKLKEDVIHPDYFVIIMNAPRKQYEMKGLGLGATIPSIQKKELLMLKMTVPSMDKQHEIIKIHDLLQAQINLERNILKKRISLKKGVIDYLTENQELTNEKVS